jgi:hypothetical protein
MTAAYLVRVIKTEEIVGFFVVDRFSELADVVDELCDPDGCEAVKLKSHGGIFIDGGAPVVPVPQSPEDDDHPDGWGDEQSEWEQKLYNHRWHTSELWSDPLLFERKTWRSVGLPEWLGKTEKEG